MGVTGPMDMRSDVKRHYILSSDRTEAAGVRQMNGKSQKKKGPMSPNEVDRAGRFWL